MRTHTHALSLAKEAWHLPRKKNLFRTYTESRLNERESLFVSSCYIASCISQRMKVGSAEATEALSSNERSREREREREDLYFFDSFPVIGTILPRFNLPRNEIGFLSVLVPNRFYTLTDCTICSFFNPISLVDFRWQK